MTMTSSLVESFRVRSLTAGNDREEGIAGDKGTSKTLMTPYTQRPEVLMSSL